MRVEWYVHFIDEAEAQNHNLAGVTHRWHWAIWKREWFLSKAYILVLCFYVIDFVCDLLLREGEERLLEIRH
jgi:hypothetical protein